MNAVADRADILQAIAKLYANGCDTGAEALVDTLTKHDQEERDASPFDIERLCGWCKKRLGVKMSNKPDPTHGICPSCYREFLGNVEN